MSLVAWLVGGGIITAVYVVIFAMMRAAGRADAMAEAAQHDAYLAEQARKAREGARADAVRRPDGLRDDDGFRRD